MGVKPGYKQSEVGVIPEDWGVAKFCDVTRVITCGLAATPIYVSEQIGRPFLSAQNIQNGKVLYDNHRFISNELFAQITKHNKPQRGDILYTRVGAGIGEAAVIEDDYVFGIYVSLTLIKIDPRKVTSHYIAHLLNSDRYRFLAKNGQFTGAGVQNLNVEVVRGFDVPVPSVAEQEAIAESLGDADALIEALAQLIAKKRQIKQGAMQELLTGKKRLPGFSGEWEMKRLGDISFLYQPTTISANQFTASGYPVYGANGVVGFFDKFNHDTWQVLVTCRGSTCGTVNRTVGKCWITGNAMVVNCDYDRQVDKTFLYYLLASQDLSTCITGTGQPQIVRAPLANFELRILNDIQEQTAIAAILSDMDAEIAALEAKLAKARQVKQGMMQELLTGRIRLV